MASEATVSANPASASSRSTRSAPAGGVRASANHLRHGSQVLEQQVQDEGLVVVGAEYSLETGAVEFFDGVPEPV